MGAPGAVCSGAATVVGRVGKELMVTWRGGYGCGREGRGGTHAF